MTSRLYKLNVTFLTLGNCLNVVVTSDRALFCIQCNLAELSLALPFVYSQQARKDFGIVSHSVTFLACQTDCAWFASGPYTA